MLSTANYHVPNEQSGSKTLSAESNAVVQCVSGNTWDITRTRITSAPLPALCYVNLKGH